MNNKKLLASVVLTASCNITSASDIERNNWIETVYADRSAGITLRDMTFPGTHDSGTYSITSSSDLHSSANSIFGAAKGIVADWAVTASDNCYQQMNSGIRYLDLRVREHKGDLILLHALVGARFEDCLVQVKQFMDENPKEIVFLDAANIPGGSYNDTMFNLFDQYFGNRKPANGKSFAELTLDELWADDADGQRNTAVILINGVREEAERRGFFNSGDIKGGYANTTSPSVMINHIENLLSDNTDSSKMLYTTYTLTPQTDDIVKDVFNIFSSGSIRDWSNKKLRAAIGDHAVTVEAQYAAKPNFIATDFHEYTSVVATAIRHNTIAPSAPAEPLQYAIASTANKVWGDHGSGSDHDGSIWRLSAEPSFYPLGDMAIDGYGFDWNIDRALVKGNQPGVAKPLGYTWIWNDRKTGSDVDVSIWRPIAAKGFVCLGDVATLNHGLEPSTDLIRCVHESYVEQSPHVNWKWNDSGSGGSYDVSFWDGHNPNGSTLNMGSLRANRSHSAPATNTFNLITRYKTEQVTPDNYRELREALAGKCLDFEGTVPANGKKVLLWDCAGVAWQKWSYNANTGLLHNKANPAFCLDNMGQPHSGGGIHMWQCNAANLNQQWNFVGSSLRPRANGSVAVDAFGRDNGAQVGMWSHHGGSNQQWSWGSL